MAQRDFGPTSDLGPTGQSVHTETYSPPEAGNNACDMGIVHSYRFVNTEGFYKLLSDEAIERSIDLGRQIAEGGDYEWELGTVADRPDHSGPSNNVFSIARFTFTNFPTYKSGYDSDITLSSGSTFQINAKDYFPSTFTITAASTAHTTTFDATGYPNNAQVLMGDYHTHKYVNTLGLYKYLLGTTHSTFNKVVDIGSYASQGYSYHEEGVLTPMIGDTIYGLRFINMQNIPAVPSAPTGTKDLDLWSYGNNSSIDLTASHSIRYINTSGTLYYKHTETAYEPDPLDVGAQTSGTSTTYKTLNIQTSYANNFFENVSLQLYNIPTKTSHFRKFTASSYVYGNNFSIDLGQYHDYKTIDTEGYLYYKYTSAAYSPAIDVGSKTSGTSTTAYTGNISTLYGGNNFYNNVNVYLTNIPTTFQWQSTNATDSDVLSGRTYYNGSSKTLRTGAMVNLQDYRYYPGATLQFRRGRTTYTDNTGATKSISSTNFITVYQQATGKVSDSQELMILASRFGNALPNQVLKTASFTSENSGSIGAAGTITVRESASSWVSPEHPVTFREGYYPSDWTVQADATIPSGWYNMNGGAKTLTLTGNGWYNYDTQSSGYTNVYNSFNIRVAVDSTLQLPDIINNYQAFPLLITRGRTTASGWNNMLVLPNYKIANAGYVGATTIGFPGTSYAKSGNQMSYGPFNISETNAVFNFLKDSSCGLTASNAFFTVSIINSTSGLYALNIRYNGWYKLEISFSSGNVVVPANNVCNLYVYSNASVIPANGNYDVSSTSKGTLLIVYGNNVSYGVNNSPSTSSTVYSAQGYGFTYRYLYKDSCLVGRISGADSTTRVSEFRIGLVYNSAMKILR